MGSSADRGEWKWNMILVVFRVSACLGLIQYSSQKHDNRCTQSFGKKEDSGFPKVLGDTQSRY